MKKKLFAFLLLLLNWTAEAKICAFHLKLARDLGFINQPIKDNDFHPLRLPTYEAFRKGRETEVLGEGSFAMVVREFSPESRVAKIYDDSPEGRAELENNKEGLDIFREYAAAQSKKQFSVPAIKGQEGNILFLQDVPGNDMLHLGLLEQTALRHTLALRYRDLIDDLGRNFENHITAKGHRVTSKEVFTDSSIPGFSSFRMLTIDQNGKEHEFRIKADNVVFDVNGKAWIIDPR